MTPFYKTLNQEHQAVLLTQMRAWGNEAIRLFEQARLPQGTIPVGAGDFDEYTLPGALRQELCSALRTQPSLEDVEAQVARRLTLWVFNHNRMRPKDVNWQRNPDTWKRDLAKLMQTLRQILT